MVIDQEGRDSESESAVRTDILNRNSGPQMLIGTFRKQRNCNSLYSNDEADSSPSIFPAHYALYEPSHECTHFRFIHTYTSNSRSYPQTSISSPSEISTDEPTSKLEAGQQPACSSGLLQDLTKELQNRPPFPITCGGYGDIYKCYLARPDGTVPVSPACALCRVFPKYHEGSSEDHPCFTI